MVSARIARRSNRALTELEHRIWAFKGFDRLIDEIVRIDNDDRIYLEYLQQPFLIDNVLPDQSAWINRWKCIFDPL